MGWLDATVEDLQRSRCPMIPAVPTNHLPRLMIADDDPVVQSMLSMSLSQGFDIVGIARDGEEAIDLARTSQPDAALVDVEMPRGGGLRAVEGIHAVAPDTAIVVLSVDESDGTVRELMQAGATTYRRKGMALQVLTQSLIDSIAAHTTARRAPA
jgi:DNA-binding NarL/FixJ family response regulator